MFSPSPSIVSIAGAPSAVPGTLTITFGRLTASRGAGPRSIVSGRCRAPAAGETSIETKPSRPSVAS